MAKKRTKFDKSQRQADQLEKKAETRPEETSEKGQSPEDVKSIAPQIVEKVT